jgi:competence protein ComEC
VDDTENARSVGVLVTYGNFRFLDLGDLTKRKEHEFMCPNNMIGTVDLFLVTHHGMDLSNSKAMDWAIHPRVAIMNNGARKGGSPAAWQIVHDSPGLEDLWQLHYAAESDRAHNVDADHIANVKENCEGKGIKVVAESDGTFTVTNERTGMQKTYTKK